VAGLIVARPTRPVARADDEVPTINPSSGNEAAIKEGRSGFRNVSRVVTADGRTERVTADQGADLRVFDNGFRKCVDTMKDR